MRYEVRHYHKRTKPYQVYSSEGEFMYDFESIEDAIKCCDELNGQQHYEVVYSTNLKPAEPEPEQTNWDALYAPLWQDAPDWAEWMAADADGIVYVFQIKPSLGSKSFIPDSRYKYVGFCINGHDWKNSLRKKPTTI